MAKLLMDDIKQVSVIIIRDLCERKGVIIHEANACSDYIRILVSISSKLSVLGFMGYLKGKS